MRNHFGKTAIAVGVALFVGSGVVVAAGDAGNTTINCVDSSPGVTCTNGVADSLNAGGTTNTTVGNGTGNTKVDGGTVAINGPTTITGTTSINGSTTINGATATITGTTSVSANVGGSSMSLNNAQAQIGSGSGSGYTAYAAPQTVTSAGLVNGDAQSKALVAGAQVTNRIQGNTLFDGDVFINGKLTYSANNSAITSVSSGTSVLSGATQNTHGHMAIGNMGQQGAVVDANGKITMGTLDQSTSALVMTNGLGNTHGFVVNETSATMSGGMNSTSLTLNDNGARFSNTATGGPVRVTGVADGKHAYDAVNYRQLQSVKAGVAGIAAMNNIPQVEQNKRAMLGVGVGHFDGSTALSIGGSLRMTQDSIVKASISTGLEGGTRNSTVYGVGAGFSW